VPFSAPWPDGWPWLHRLLRRFVPAVMEQLVPGEQVYRFGIGSADGRQWTAAAAICYEGTFARVCRRLVYDLEPKGRDGLLVGLCRWLGYVWAPQKKADCLINLSNDGWFVAQWSGRTWASSELDQHLAAYVFRAIENRLPVVRAVNTGISGFIDANGRIVELVGHESTTTPKMATGTVSREVLVDRRRSVYSSVGDAAAQVNICIAGLLVFILCRRKDKELQGDAKS